MILNYRQGDFNIALSALCFIFLFQYCKGVADGVQLQANRDINIDANLSVSNRYNVIAGITKILIRNITEDDGFFLIQVHSFAQKVTLTNDTNFNLQNSVNGSDIGLVKILLPTDATKTFPYYLRANQNGMVLIAVTIYSSADPIPGGCSMTFNTDIAPYLNMTYTNALIEVNYQNSSIFGHLCEDGAVGLEMYRLYLQPYNLNSDAYFDSIQKMLSVDYIRRNGENIVDSGGRISSLRKYISGYMGVGQVFAVVAVAGNRSSAYVPAVTYSCNIMNGSDSCYDYNFTVWGLFSTIMLIFGIVMLIAQDLVGLLSMYFTCLGIFIYIFYIFFFYASTYVVIISLLVFVVLYGIYGFIVFILIKKNGLMENREQANFIISILCGLFIGAFAVTWGQTDNYTSSIYWSIFIATSSVIFVLIFGMTFVNPFAYNLMAVFIIVTSFSYFSGDTLHYMVTEVIRYMTVEHYDIAVKFNLYSASYISFLIVGVFFALIRTICVIDNTNRTGRLPIVIRLTRRNTYLSI